MSEIKWTSKRRPPAHEVYTISVGITNCFLKLENLCPFCCLLLTHIIRMITKKVLDGLLWGNDTIHVVWTCPANSQHFTITKTVDNIQAQFTSATLSGPPRSLMSSSKVLGGNALLRMSSLSNSSFFIALHKSAAELEGNDGLLDDDIKLESAGALAEWCSVVKCPEEK